MSTTWLELPADRRGVAFELYSSPGGLQIFIHHKDSETGLKYILGNDYHTVALEQTLAALEDYNGTPAPAQSELGKAILIAHSRGGNSPVWLL
jgi:hypothetical protein